MWTCTPPLGPLPPYTPSPHLSVQVPGVDPRLDGVVRGPGHGGGRDGGDEADARGQGPRAPAAARAGRRLSGLRRRPGGHGRGGGGAGRACSAERLSFRTTATGRAAGCYRQTCDGPMRAGCQLPRLVRIWSSEAFASP